MAADLPTDWLAKTLDTVDDEARRWPQGLKDSYRHLTGNEIGPDPRDQRIADLEDALRSLVADCDDYAQTNNLAGTWATLDEILKAVDDMLAIKVPIGSLHGEVVYLRQSDRTLHFGDISCSVDHPYLKGTKIAEAALRHMGE